MKYRKEHPSKDISQALYLTKTQVTRLTNAIKKAYDQEWHKDGPNVDQIYGMVAPYIKTPEEAFYASTVILTDIFGSLREYQKSNVN